jgi:hypothetical protein
METQVLTAFPNTSYARGAKIREDLRHVADLFQCVVESHDGPNPKITLEESGATLVTMLLVEAMTTMTKMRQHESLDFLELFREEIGKVVRDLLCLNWYHEALAKPIIKPLASKSNQAIFSRLLLYKNLY